MNLFEKTAHELHDMLVNKEKALYNKYIVVRRGKKKYYLVIFN